MPRHRAGGEDTLPPAARRRKQDLPGKTCQACGRPFAWRRKWARVWQEVRYCSKACRDGRHAPARGGAPSAGLKG